MLRFAVLTSFLAIALATGSRYRGDNDEPIRDEADADDMDRRKEHRNLDDLMEPRGFEDHEELRSLEEQLDRKALEEELIRRSLEEQIYSCKNNFDECSSFPPCCGSLQCYWADGFSVTTKGVCVPCVDRTQVCQRDSQCCSPLVCHKDNRFNVNGVCNVKRALGAECHDSDQCESNFCSIKWYDDVKGRGGKCATHTKRYLQRDDY